MEENFTTAVLIEHTKTFFDIENIFQSKKATKLVQYIEEILGYKTESHDFFWNIKNEYLEENGQLKKDIDFSTKIFGLDCPVIYIYVKNKILQVNFPLSWEAVVTKSSLQNEVVDSVKELMLLLESKNAILLPTSQGEDYPSSALKAAKVVLHLDKINSLSDALEILSSDAISNFKKYEGSFDQYLTISN